MILTQDLDQGTPVGRRVVSETVLENARVIAVDQDIARARTEAPSAQGTGVLLRLPNPAATLMSADPGVARVQPASSTSLFLMGVTPGRTTVIATSDAGTAIAQYDVTVAPGARVTAPAAVGGAPAAPVRVSAATALAIQSAIAQTMNGAASARVRAAGSEVILSGTVPNAPAAQQAEAIARAYVGEKAVWSTHCWCLAAFRSMSGSV